MKRSEYVKFQACGYIPETREVSETFRVCQDCIYYSAYGTLDDTAMLDMEEDLEEAPDVRECDHEQGEHRDNGCTAPGCACIASGATYLEAH